MKCVLASLGFKNENIAYNKRIILDTIQEYSNKADIILFGEAFLQGFYGINFNVRHDDALALEKDDPILHEIRRMAKEKSVAVSFGFIEKEADRFYSSQITISSAGAIADLYRRVSPGWKENYAGKQYCEGVGFQTFEFLNKKILIGLCGDLWFDKNIGKIKELKPDIVFWPVYTDYNYEAWNKRIKFEYAEQAQRACSTVLYVNSFCLDKEENEIAKGGAAVFVDGVIQKEIPAGKEGILLVDL